MNKKLIEHKRRMKSIQLAFELHRDNIGEQDAQLQGTRGQQEAVAAHQIHKMMSDLRLLHDALVKSPTVDCWQGANLMYIMDRHHLGNAVLQELI